MLGGIRLMCCPLSDHLSEADGRLSNVGADLAEFFPCLQLRRQKLIRVDCEFVVVAAAVVGLLREQSVVEERAVAELVDLLLRSVQRLVEC